MPKFCKSCDSHFLVVPSSFRAERNVASFSCSGKHCLRASLALHRRGGGREGGREEGEDGGQGKEGREGGEGVREGRES